MKAVVFCGGEGTRLRPLTLDIPKPMIPIHGRTVLEHLFDLFKKYDIKHVILTLCYLKEKIKGYFGNGSKFGLTIDYLEEDILLGTANHLDLVRDYLSETFVVSNGDELKNINLKKMVKKHRDAGAVATIAVREIENPSIYGVVRLKGDKILEFIEKPSVERAPSRFVNAGLYIMEPDILKYIPKTYAMLEREIFPLLAREGKLYAYKFKGQWFDTGTFERYEDAKKKWKGIR